MAFSPFLALHRLPNLRANLDLNLDMVVISFFPQSRCAIVLETCCVAQLAHQSAVMIRAAHHLSDN